MDAIMRIVISVQSEQARQALAQMQSGFAGVADAAETSSARAGGAYKEMVAEVTAARKALQDSLAEDVATTAEAAAVTDEYVVARTRQAVVDLQVAAATTAAVDAAKEQLGIDQAQVEVLGPYAELSQQVAAAKIALADAILLEGANSERAAAQREALINAEMRDILVSRELAAAHDAAAASMKIADESSLAFGQNLEKGLNNLEKTGKQAQWAGRQIQYTLGLPLLIAGGAGAYFALQNEKAGEALQRAYQPLAKTVAGVTHETDLLNRAWRDLSDIYGVQQSQVIGIATEWAKLGASGTNLVGVVRETLNVMALSGQSNTDATKTLIALRQQYGLTASGLHLALAQINEAQLHSAVSFNDFSNAIIRGGSAAVAAGVPLRNYLALVAAISPQAGSAQLAANGLKTIFSRLLAPTAQSAKALQEVGISIDNTTWKSSNGAQRIQLLAQAFEKLTPAQQAAASSTIASRFQITRFDALIKDITNSTGEYNTVLKATADNNKVLQDYTNNITHYLSSTPQAFHIALTEIENAAAQVILPLLPHILALVQQVVGLVRWFSNLDPRIQQLVISGLAFIVVFGEVKRLFGATEVLVSGLGKSLLGVARQFGLFAGQSEAAAAASAAPWLILVGIAALIAYAWRDQLGEAFRWLQQTVVNDVPDWWNTMVESIGNAIAALPEIFAKAFEEVVQIVDAAAMDVYRLFSYLNPFAHHSPSLVEQTQKGKDVVGSHYTQMAESAQTFKDAHISATQSVQRAPSAPVSYTDPSSSAAVAATRFAAPNLPKFDFTSVNSYKAALAGVNSALATQQNILKSLEAQQSKESAQLTQAKQLMQDWASEPIAGMKAMSDQIFANDQAQKQLNLSILKLQDSYGSVDDMTSRMSKLNGEMQLLQGRKMDLHNAGAGSDVTGGIDAQIKSVQQSQAGILGHVNDIDQLQTRLDKLARTGQELQLEQSLKFDPLTRQISDLANAQKEYPFDTIIAHVREERAQVDQLTAAYAKSTAAVNAQKGVVGLLENTKKAIEAANPASSGGAKKAKSGGFDALAHAGGASFPGISAQPSFGKPGNLDDLVKQMDQAAAKFGKMDLFGGVKKAIDKFFGDTKQKIVMTIAAIGLAIVGGIVAATIGLPVVLGAALGAAIGLVLGKLGVNLPWGKMWSGIKNGFGDALAFVKSIPGRIGDALAGIPGRIGSVLAPIGGFLAPIGRFFQNAFGSAERAVAGAVHAIGGWLTQFGKWLSPLTHELGQWGGTIQRVFSVTFGVASSIVRGFIAIIRAELNFLMPIFTAVFGFVFSIVSTNFRAILALVRTVLSVVVPLVVGGFHLMVSSISVAMHLAGDVIRVVWAVIRGIFQTAVGLIKTIVVGGFTALRQIITGALQVIRGVINLALDLITGKWGAAWRDVKLIASGVWSLIQGIVMTPMHMIQSGITTVLGAIQGIWHAAWSAMRDGVSTIFGGLADVVTTPLQWVINGIAAAINAVLDVLRVAADAYNHIPFVTHIHIPDNVSAPQIGGGGGGGGRGSGNHRQFGGTMGSGWGVVGENGPEIMKFGSTSTVVPLRASDLPVPLRSALGNGGNGNTTVMHFHGNLSFPNVTGGHDAEEFMRQLESMATTS